MDQELGIEQEGLKRKNDNVSYVCTETTVREEVGEVG